MRSDDVVDYDADGYDYRGYWRGREYEEWAEGRALSRTVGRVRRSRWFADFGGAFGRNAIHYLDRTDHAVIMDYSATNLANAAKRYPEFVRSGRLHLIRCDLNAIPFRDHTFDAAMVIRVLHHLGADLPRGLVEMSRTVAGAWIVDVPIKHHVFGLLRAARPGRWSQVRGAEPLLVGQEEPYWNFQLTAVREQLRALGWRPTLAASVNNLRRWDRLLPPRLAGVVRPAAYGAELALQRAGRGWWGPSQVVLAERYDPPVAFQPSRTDPELAPVQAGLAARMACPACLRSLAWSANEACCAWCCLAFVRRGDFWDFACDSATVRVRPRTGAVTVQPGPVDDGPMVGLPELGLPAARLWPAPTNRPTNQRVRRSRHRRPARS